MEMGGWRYAFIWSPTADLKFALIHFQYITKQFCEKNVSTLDFVLADHFARVAISPNKQLYLVTCPIHSAISDWLTSVAEHQAVDIYGLMTFVLLNIN